MQTVLTIRRDQVVPGVVFQSSHGYKVLVTHVIDDAPSRSDNRHVQIEGHLHARPGARVVVERYPAWSVIEVESFGPLPEGCETAEQREERLFELRRRCGLETEAERAKIAERCFAEAR